MTVNSLHFPQMDSTMLVLSLNGVKYNYRLTGRRFLDAENCDRLAYAMACSAPIDLPVGVSGLNSRYEARSSHP
jgi:hypothetical protein